MNKAELKEVILDKLDMWVSMDGEAGPPENTPIYITDAGEGIMVQVGQDVFMVKISKVQASRIQWAEKK